MKKIFIAIITLTLILCSCSLKQAKIEKDKLQVYTSFYAMYDFAKQIGGDKAEVHILCPPSQEPHDFEPTAQDMVNLSEADVFIYNGMGMEHWTDSVISSLDSNVAVVEASAYIKSTTENNDPHVWLNPDNAYDEMCAIADAFKKKDNKNADYYDTQLNIAEKKIDELNNKLDLAKQDFKTDKIVVPHEAYTHLCNRLGIEQMSVNKTDNSGDPTAKKIVEVENFIKENNIKYIFTEPLGIKDIIESIANDTGAEILVLDPFGGNIDNKDYFTVMDENIDALKKALD